MELDQDEVFLSQNGYAPEASNEYTGGDKLTF
jgi:hypothetical protein